MKVLGDTEEQNRLSLDAMAGIESLLKRIGADTQSDGLRQTPKRFVKAFLEMTSGYSIDPKEILSTSFEENFDELILLTGIEFTSLCEHHLLPFVGTASIGYIPNGNKDEEKRVVGISKLARLLDCFARRLQIQERLAMQIADALDEHLKPQGVGVVIEAKHFCMVCRGVVKQNAIMKTAVFRGALRSEASARAEFLSLIKGE